MEMFGLCSMFQHHHLYRVNNFSVYLNCWFIFSIVFSFFLPWSVSSLGATFPCNDDDPQFDTITCSPSDTLILTLGDYYYEGDCSSYPFTVNPNSIRIIDRKTEIIASLVDNKGVIYFFERNNVIIIDHGRHLDRKINSIFNNLSEKIIHAVLIPNPPSDVKLEQMIIIFTEKTIHYFGHRKTGLLGLPLWTEPDPWKIEKGHLPGLNKSLPLTINRIIGVKQNLIKTISVWNNGSQVIYTADITFCLFPSYHYHLFECLDENPDFGRHLHNGPLFKCLPTTQFSDFSLLSIMLYGSLFLIILATLGLTKCVGVWLFKKLRPTRLKVRFQEDKFHKDNPNKFDIFHRSYGNDNLSRIQTYGFDSVVQSAVSINDDYKDINYSSDVGEDEIMKESESTLPLDSIQSSNMRFSSQVTLTNHLLQPPTLNKAITLKVKPRINQRAGKS